MLPVLFTVEFYLNIDVNSRQLSTITAYDNLRLPLRPCTDSTVNPYIIWRYGVTHTKFWMPNNVLRLRIYFVLYVAHQTSKGRRILVWPKKSTYLCIESRQYHSYITESTNFSCNGGHFLCCHIVLRRLTGHRPSILTNKCRREMFCSGIHNCHGWQNS